MLPHVIWLEIWIPSKEETICFLFKPLSKIGALELSWYGILSQFVVYSWLFDVGFIKASREHHPQGWNWGFQTTFVQGFWGSIRRYETKSRNFKRYGLCHQPTHLLRFTYIWFRKGHLRTYGEDGQDFRRPVKGDKLVTEQPILCANAFQSITHGRIFDLQAVPRHEGHEKEVCLPFFYW